VAEGELGALGSVHVILLSGYASMSWKGVSVLYHWIIVTNDKSLAWCELYVMFAKLFRIFQVSIHDTSDADMEWVDAVLIV
jgi:hypothetical protein